MRGHLWEWLSALQMHRHSFEPLGKALDVSQSTEKPDQQKSYFMRPHYSMPHVVVSAARGTCYESRVPACSS